MKRSEMINLIHDYMVDQQLNFGPTPFRDIAWSEAEGLLEKMESAGMLPPETKFYDENSKLVIDAGYKTYAFGWEEE